VRRRALLAVVVVAMVALAGCADAAGSLRMTPVDDAELVDRASRPTTGADRYPAIDRQRVARRVIENAPVNASGTATANVTAPRPPVSTDLPHEYRGTYYELSYEAVDTQPGVATLVSIDYNATDPNGTRIAFADLSPADRRKLRPRLANPPATRRSGPDADVLLAYERPAARNSTLLAHAGGSVVIVDGRTEYALRVRETKEEPLRTFRYDVTRVAGSPAVYADRLRAEYAFALDGLTDAERDTVEAARGDAYYAESTDDEAFGALVDRFRRHRAVERDGSSGSWLVRYEGRLYWAELRYGAFAERTAATETPSVTPH